MDTTQPIPRVRRSRRDRPTKRAGRLTERDIELLTFVGRSRIATTEALAVAFFGDRSTCSRLLARLSGAGLLRVHVEHLNAPNIYYLSERAAELLVGEGVDEDALHVGRLPKHEALEHLRHLAELRAAFLAAVRLHEELTLDLFLADHDLRRMAAGKVPSYVPDALVKVSSRADSQLRLAIEVDLAHQSARYIAETKGRATHALSGSGAPLWGLPTFRPLFLAPTAARLRTVAQALAGEHCADLWWGTTFDRLATEGVLGRAFLTMAEVIALPRTEPLVFTRSVLDDLR